MSLRGDLKQGTAYHKEAANCISTFLDLHNDSTTERTAGGPCGQFGLERGTHKRTFLSRWALRQANGKRLIVLRKGSESREGSFLELKPAIYRNQPLRAYLEGRNAPLHPVLSNNYFKGAFVLLTIKKGYQNWKVQPARSLLMTRLIRDGSILFLL